MTTRNSDRGIPSHRFGSPLQATAILLGVCVVIYLAVVGVVFVLAAPNAAAVAPDLSLPTASAASAPSPTIDAAACPPEDTLDGDPDWAGSTRARRMSPASDSSNYYD